MLFRLSLISILFFSTLAAADVEICKNVTLKDGRFKFTKNELILICGSDRSDTAWKEIPLPQAEYQLNIIFQNKGYYHARFERRENRLDVWKGEVTKTEHLLIEGAKGLLNGDKMRKIKRYALESKKLDEVKEWADLKLRRKGYACNKIELHGDVVKKSISAQIDSGEKKVIGKIERTGLQSLDEEAISRYEAFYSGEDYDVILTQITSARLLNQGLFQSAYFTNICDPGANTVGLHLFADVGKARILRIGFGASTEEFPFADIWLKNARLDDRASNYTLALHASPIRQRLDGSSELYILPFTKRTYLGPRFKIERRVESAYELIATGVGVDLGRDWDMLHQRWQTRAGPTFNYEKTVRGIGPADFRYLSWEGSVTVMSHDYEAFSANQDVGYTAGFNYRGQREGVGSPINVDRYDFTLKHLWNLGSLAPPFLVLASRMEAVAVDTRQTENALAADTLPIDYRIFYGGDSNLRGFARESINRGGRGYLSALHGGIEIRLIDELPYHLEPFLLGDLARLGSERLTLGDALFTSSGFGIRWASPFGTLRGSAARGSIWGGDASTSEYKQEWVYFISFGQEF